jgi:hypothetical protein
MKKVYTALVALCFAGNIQAQQLPSVPQLASDLVDIPSERTHSVQKQTSRTLLWNEDFANGFNSVNGLWTAEGTNADIWDHVLAVDSACFSRFGDPAVNFTTKANGFMIFHSDSANCINSTTTPPIFNQTLNTGQLISPPIDLSEESAVLVSFEHRFRHCCATAFQLWFSVSVDGGATWQDYNVTGNTPVNIYNTNLNPSFNISPIAANQSDVRFKFSWNATNSSSHYFWAIDDIAVEIPVDNDMSLADFNYQQWDLATAADYADLKHTIYHIDQVRPLNIQAFATNKGALIQTGVVLHAAISTPGGVVNLSSSAQNVAVADTAVFEIPWTPAGDVGNYVINLEITQNEEEQSPEDNVGSVSILIDDFLMARDDRARSGAFTNYVDELRAALAYTFTADATIYAIDVALDNSSDLGTFFNTQLLDVNLDFMVESDVAIVDQTMLNVTGDENFARLNLESPYSAIQGESVFPAFVHFGGADEANIALSGFCPDQTCFVWATIESNGQECQPCFFNTQPMIRPVLAFVNSIEGTTFQHGIRLGQNVPNPARDFTIIGIELEQTTPDVSLEIRDVSGRLVQQKLLGTLVAGEHTEILDTAALKAGVYLYTLYTPNDRQTKRMSIVK